MTIMTFGNKTPFSVADNHLRLEGNCRVILWWTKWRWGRFSPSTSVSPANLYSTNCSKNHPHLSSGVCAIGQRGRSTRDLDT
jgi:hypothetical protein